MSLKYVNISYFFNIIEGKDFWKIPNIFKTNYQWMSFVTAVSLSFDMKLHRAFSVKRLNLIYFKTGDYSRFNNHGTFANVAYVRSKF